MSTPIFNAHILSDQQHVTFMPSAQPPIHHILSEEQNSRIQLNDRIYERGNSTPETCSKLLEAKLTPYSSSSSCNNF